MNLSISMCKFMNKFFTLPIHPFNLHNKGLKSYADWQYEKGYDTIRFYLNKYDLKDLFKNKVVLDIGCGAGGKTIYYASMGVEKIIGLEILSQYQSDAVNFAKSKNLQDKFEFSIQDASCTTFDDATFDTIIMNDAMEHFQNPQAVLHECYRILKPGGKLFLNFPPYHHPYGAHLSDAIGIPWVHCLFNDNTLIKVYKDLVTNLPDGQDRIQFRIAKTPDGKEYFSYINKITIKKFKEYVQNTPFIVDYYDERPLREFVMPLCRLPYMREYFIKMVIAVLKK